MSMPESSAVLAGSSQELSRLLTPTPLASVIIRTFNEARHLPQALAQLTPQILSSPDPALELIVVDSGSSDGTSDIARRAGARVVPISKEHFTFGRSLNLGCESARGDYLVFISGHCIPLIQNWLEQLLSPFENPAVGMTYGRQIGGQFTKFSEARVFAKYYPPDAPSQGPAFCNNANAALRRSLWRRFRFEEDLTGLEDLAMGKTLVRAGFAVSYAPGAVVQHLHEESWTQVHRRYEREAIALQSIQPDLQFHAWDALLCFCKAVWGDLVAAFLASSLGALNSIVAYRWNQYHGAWRGHTVHRKLTQQEKLRYFYPS
jgi:glycosyltransferase involved in cell wall biosynthesis